MTTTIENTKPRQTMSVPMLVRTVKAHLGKADKSEEKVEQHYRSAGLLLKELKVYRPIDLTWIEYLRENFDISQEWADQLIRIADGKTTVEKVRAGTAGRMRKLRAKNKQVSRDTGSKPPVRSVPETSACDINWSNPPLEEFDSPIAAYTAQAKNYAAGATQEAHAFPFLADDCPASSITEEILELVREAATAWADLLAKLELRKKTTTAQVPASDTQEADCSPGVTAEPAGESVLKRFRRPAAVTPQPAPDAESDQPTPSIPLARSFDSSRARSDLTMRQQR
jgi:hypothetical protein